MSNHSGSSSSKKYGGIVGAVAMLAVLLLAGLAQAAAKPVVVNTQDYTIIYKAVGTPITNPSGTVSYRGIAFNPSMPVAAITVSTTGPLTIQINGNSVDQLSIKKKKGVVTGAPILSLISTGGFAKLYTDAEIGELRVLGNILSLSSKTAPVDDAIANGFGSIKLGSVGAAPGMTVDTWRASTQVSKKALAGKTTLVGIPLANAFMLRQNAALTVSAKKLKTGMVPASVLAGAIITGEAVSVSVRGGDLLATTVQAQQGIKLLASTQGKDGVGGTLGVVLTTQTLSLYLANDALALVQNPASLFGSGLNGPSNAKTDAKQGIGTVSATTAINGVFVAGGTQPAELLVEPNFSASVKTYKAPAATGDAFVQFGAKKQPVGIITHASLQ